MMGPVLASVLQLRWEVSYLELFEVLYLAIRKMAILDLTHITAKAGQCLKTKLSSHRVLQPKVHREACRSGVRQTRRVEKEVLK